MTKLIAGNWKMFKGPTETLAFFDAFEAPDGVDVVLCPPFVSLEAAVGEEWPIYAQNVHWADVGCIHRRDLSARCSSSWASRGRSSGTPSGGRSSVRPTRRSGCAPKRRSLPASRVIACVGETEAERERGETEAVLTRQVGVLPRHASLVIAYEPVWAIGTGKTATPEMAQDAHALIKSLHDTRVLYGGSVKPENAEELLDQPAVDGALVGGASLDPASFSDLCRIAASLS